MSRTPMMIAATSEVGRPQTLSEKLTIVAFFHEFESLPHTNGDYTFSPAMSCHGHTWKIKLYPGDRDKDDQSDDQPYISIFLAHKTGNKVKADYCVRVGSMTHSSKSKQFKTNGYWGWRKFLAREKVLDPTKAYLENGTLKVYVDIQVWIDAPTVWVPRKRLRLTMLESFESGNEGDVCFKVGDKSFVVYTGLIARCAPTLGEIAASSGQSGRDIPIHNVDPSIFETLLRFIYTDELPDNTGNPREVLQVADRFGCSRLKLIAEAEIVKAGIDAQNAAELLLFADSHSCALLREAALEFCISHLLSVKNSEGWEQLKESRDLLTELVGASPTQFTDSDYDTMRVATLRQKLEDKGMEVDGTRETLIKRLKDAEEN